MKKVNRFVPLFLFVLLLSSLACNFSMEMPWDAGPDDVAISQEDISVAATRAAEAAATAAALASEAGQLAATVAAEGDNAVATVVSQGDDGVEEDQDLVTGSTAVGESALEQKLANIQPDANGNFSVAITEADLNDFIGGQGGAIQTDTFSAQNIQVRIIPEYVELTGDVSEPIALPLEVKLSPVVTGDQVRFDLISASAGIFPVPDSMLDLIEAAANSELSKALIGLPSGTTLQDATLANGVLTLFGQQN